MENLCDTERIYEEVDCPLITKAFINDAEDGEDEDDKDEDEDNQDDQEDEVVIIVSDDY